MAEILFKDLSYAIVGAALEVPRTLGPGFLEGVYQAALAHELGLRAIRFEQFKKLPVTYRGLLIGEYEADIVVEGCVILEPKAVHSLHPKHEA
jgi:GxxExxY protein